MQETKETQIPSLGQEDPLEKEMTTHFSIPAWRISWTEEPGRLQRVSQSQTLLKQLSTHTLWKTERKKWFSQKVHETKRRLFSKDGNHYYAFYAYGKHSTEFEKIIIEVKSIRQLEWLGAWSAEGLAFDANREICTMLTGKKAKDVSW